MVRLALSAAVLTVCLILVGTAGAEKNAPGTVSGKITKLDLKDAGGTIEVTAKKKGEEGKATTVKVDSTTKVMKAAAEKGQAPEKCSASDLQVGQRVDVTLGSAADAAASKIVIRAKKK